MSNWADITQAADDQILAWAESQSWAKAMTDCQQDALWHAEGDVWTHTRMVFAEVQKIEDWPSLDRPNQIKLLFSALFHDAGKPATTEQDPETGRTRSPKHSQAGAEIARRVLRELGCELTAREEIVNMVRFHGRPSYMLERAGPEREVISLSSTTSGKRWKFLLTMTKAPSFRPLENAAVSICGPDAISSSMPPTFCA